jgi:predicted metal-dependent hydrolase
MAAAATMRTPVDHRVIPRNMHFDTEASRGVAWMNGDPVATAVFNALSLTFPDGERLFIDAVRAFRDQLSGKLAEDAKAFIVQESMHTREHIGLNAGLDRAHYPVDAIETELRQRMKRLRGFGPLAMLGVTIALEHFTAMLADLFLDDPDFWTGVPEDVVRLWQWHAMEEAEHKAVAFDVFLEISKDWPSWRRYQMRARAMMIVTILFNLNIVRFASALLRADGMGAWTARGKVLNYLYGNPGLFRRGWRAYWDWYRPGFHPWNHDSRAKLAIWRPKFAPAES